MKQNVRILCVSVIFILATLALVSGPASLWSVGTLGTSRLALVVRADDDDDDGAFAQGQVICKVRSRANPFVVAARHAMTVLEDLEDGVFLFDLPEGLEVEDAVEELSEDPDVIEAEPNFFLEVPEVDQRSIFFNDGQPPSIYVAQNALEVIRARQAQARADGSGVIVSVIDTGIDATHSVFTRVAPGYDFVDNDPSPTEVSGGVGYGHGTFVAGIVVLVAPGATILPVRALGPDGRGKASNVGKAIRLAARQGADVINMSFGALAEPLPIRQAIAFAASQGATLIASAGNRNTSAPQYPASDAAVLAVAATDEADRKADFSNYGSHIAVCAPGVGIYSAFPGGDYAIADGTSYAAPFVSGVAALVLSAGTGSPNVIIKATAVNIDALNPGFRGLLGNGRVNALAAVSP